MKIKLFFVFYNYIKFLNKIMFEYERFLIVISAPSGTGKSSLINEILKTEKDIQLSVSATTRDKRVGEIDKVNYYFLTREEFKEKIDNDEFYEYAEVFGNYYGTLKSQIEEKFKNGNNVFLDIDYQGAEKITKQIDKKKLLKIFIVPPSLEELRKRLISRGRDEIKDIENRLSKAELEIKQSVNYDYVIVNDDFETAISEIKLIINAKKIQNKNLNENLKKICKP